MKKRIITIGAFALTALTYLPIQAKEKPVLGDFHISAGVKASDDEGQQSLRVDLGAPGAFAGRFANRQFNRAFTVGYTLDWKNKGTKREQAVIGVQTEKLLSSDIDGSFGEHNVTMAAGDINGFALESVFPFSESALKLNGEIARNTLTGTLDYRTAGEVRTLELFPVSDLEIGLRTDFSQKGNTGSFRTTTDLVYTINHQNWVGGGISYNLTNWESSSYDISMWYLKKGDSSGARLVGAGSFSDQRSFVTAQLQLYLGGKPLTGKAGAYWRSQGDRENGGAYDQSVVPRGISTIPLDLSERLETGFGVELNGSHVKTQSDQQSSVGVAASYTTQGESFDFGLKVGLTQHMKDLGSDYTSFTGNFFVSPNGPWTAKVAITGSEDDLTLSSGIEGTW